MAAAALAAPIKSVEISGQVILKILQHCNEALPHLVTGQLLGLDVGQTLEVTDCFPFPVGAALKGSAMAAPALKNACSPRGCPPGIGCRLAWLGRRARTTMRGRHTSLI